MITSAPARQAHIQAADDRPTLVQSIALMQIHPAGSALKTYLPALREKGTIPAEYANGLRNHLAEVRAEIDATIAHLDGSEVSRG